MELGGATAGANPFVNTNLIGTGSFGLLAVLPLGQTFSAGTQ